MSQNTAPNALNLEAETVGMRIRLNGGTTPQSIWVLSSWMARCDRDLEDNENPSWSNAYTTREVALADYRVEIETDIAEWEPEDRAEVDIDDLLQRLDANGEIDLDYSHDGCFHRLEEVVLWSGSRH